MKIIIASWPAAGHLDPLLGQVRMLIADGHEVVVYTGSTLRSRVEATGAEFAALPPEVDYDMRGLDRYFPVRRHLDPVARVLHDFEKLFLGSMSAQYRGLRALLRQFPAECIIAEQCFYGIVPLLVGPKNQRPAIIGCGITFLAIDRDDGLPHGIGLPYQPDPAAAEAQQAKFMPLARTMLDPLQAFYDDTLTSLGLRPAGQAISVIATHSDAFLQAGVPELDYPHAGLPDRVHFIGNWPAAPASAPVPDWAPDLDEGRRVVLVTQGTFANGDLNDLVLPTIKALAHREDLLVVATSGGGDITEVAGQLPANARLASYLPFDWLMPKVDALVTNGGFGTIMQALAAGVPLVVAGITEDKPEVAARVQWSGVGINLKTNMPSHQMLHDAVIALLGSSEYSDRAQEVAASFARHDCADILRGTLERLLPVESVKTQIAMAMSW